MLILNIFIGNLIDPVVKVNKFNDEQLSAKDSANTLSADLLCCK